MWVWVWVFTSGQCLQENRRVVEKRGAAIAASSLNLCFHSIDETLSFSFDCDKLLFDFEVKMNIEIVKESLGFSF